MIGLEGMVFCQQLFCHLEFLSGPPEFWCPAMEQDSLCATERLR